MRVTVTKYRTLISVKLDIDDGDCPACAALRQFGCKEGIIFLECNGVIHRCYVAHFFGLAGALCEIVSREDADKEIAGA